MRNSLAIPACAILLLAMLAACSPPKKQSLGPNAIIPVPPPRAPLGNWAAVDDHATVVQSVNGATLRGWTFRPMDNSPARLHLLLFNGNAMTIDNWQFLYRDLAAPGVDVTSFDYRGYGFSTGKADVMDFRRDALALYDELARKGPVVVYGFSMGTAMAAYVASQRHAAGLILAGTIATAAEEFPVYARAQGMNPAQIAAIIPDSDAVAAFDEKGLIGKSGCPLLMLHGEVDHLVPIEQGNEVFAASPVRQKTFLTVPGAGHDETITATASLEAVRTFLGSILKSIQAG